MVSTRSKARKLNNDGSMSWSSLSHDLLIFIMMRVGFFDFIALSGVCKSWRSVAISNWNQVMMSKQPMCLSLADRINEKECFLEENYSRRKLKTMIPHSGSWMCIGLTCGYLIFSERKTGDFWLVNPVTRKELHFPGFPFHACVTPRSFRGILVFSLSMSGWVFVVLKHSFSSGLSFSLAGKQAEWSYVYSDSLILDMYFFKGKIYTMNRDKILHELRLNSVPAFILHKMNNSPWSNILYDKFVSSGEKLYLVDSSRHKFDTVEVNFDRREWMNREKTIGEYAVFISSLKCDAAIKQDMWVNPWTQYQRLNYPDGGDQSWKAGMRITTSMWYFPHDCLNDRAENGILLNILEE